MSGPSHGPFRLWQFHRLEGACARARGQGREACPHPSDSKARWHWIRGWHAQDRIARAPEIAAERRRAAARDQWRRHPGRGRSILGRRREWSAAEMRTALRMRGDGRTLTEIGQEVGRSVAAVKTFLFRQKHQQRGAQP